MNRIQKDCRASILFESLWSVITLHFLSEFALKMSTLSRIMQSCTQVSHTSWQEMIRRYLQPADQYHLGALLWHRITAFDLTKYAVQGVVPMVARTKSVFLIDINFGYESRHNTDVLWWFHFVSKLLILETSPLKVKWWTDNASVLRKRLQINTTLDVTVLSMPRQ